MTQSSFKKEQAPTDNKITHWLPLFGLFISISSILLWSAGYCYRMGYWQAANLEQTFINISFQEVLIYGAAPAYNWIGLVLTSGFYFVLFIVFSFSIKLPTAVVKKPLATRKKRLQIDVDKDAIRVAAIFGSICALSLIGILCMKVLWMPAATRHGINDYYSDVCDEEIREATKKSALASVMLDSKNSISGKILQHTEKFILLLNSDALHVITASDAPKLIEKITVPKLECAVIFPEKYASDHVSNTGKIAAEQQKVKRRQSWAAFFLLVVFCALTCAAACWMKIFGLNHKKFECPENKASRPNNEVYLLVYTLKLQNELNRYAGLSMVVAISFFLISLALVLA